MTSEGLHCNIEKNILIYTSETCDSPSLRERRTKVLVYYSLYNLLMYLQLKYLLINKIIVKVKKKI